MVMKNPNGPWILSNMSRIASGIKNKPTAIKPLSQYSDLLDIKNKNTVCRFGAKKKRKETRKSTPLWYNI